MTSDQARLIKCAIKIFVQEKCCRNSRAADHKTHKNALMTCRSALRRSYFPVYTENSMLFFASYSNS